MAIPGGQWSDSNIRIASRRAPRTPANTGFRCSFGFDIARRTRRQAGGECQIHSTRRALLSFDISRFDATNFAFASCHLGEEVGPLGLGGATMTDGFLSIDSTGITRHVSLWGQYSDRADDMPSAYLKTAIGWLPIALVFAAAGWLLLLNYTRERAPAVHPAAAVAAKPATALTVGLARDPVFNPATSEAIVPGQPAPVDRMKITSQSWRRGGLGSNALVTITLRNDNSYAVKDVALSCAFLRPDGSRLTDRSRVIADVINMKSRKAFARLHVGFVNVNAARVKCSPIAASHI